MIAILGASGYVGGSLARVLSARGEPLWLFCRDPSALARNRWPDHVRPASLAEFSAAEFGLVVNAIGAGDPARVAALGADILTLTQHWDERVLSTMTGETRYVFLSSGAIYGALNEPAEDATALRLPVNRLESTSPYAIAKLAAEVRHRHRPDSRILDVRVFGFADRTIALGGRFFLSELARSVADKTPFITSPADMVRDYAGAVELEALITHWLAADAPNRVVDLYTREPMVKSAILPVIHSRYGIEIVRSDSATFDGTSAGSVYASAVRTAATLGYQPRRTSSEVVLEMLDSIRAPNPG